MTSIYDVEPNELIAKAAEELKKLKELTPPSWASFVKTGAHRERPPANPDWWYFRAAAVLRAIYKLGPIGVSKLRTKYGGAYSKSMSPERFFKGSGSIIRKVLQQLEKAGFVKQGAKGIHKGRIITPKGISFLDKIADNISKSSPKEAKPKAEEKPVIKEQKQEKPKEKKAEKKSAKKPEEPKAEIPAEIIQAPAAENV